MLICAPIGAEPRGSFASPLELVEQAVTAEAEGFPCAWGVHFSQCHDALSVLAVAASRTERIELGVGIVPTYPRHPLALAQQAATVQAIAGGRLTLGVGVSHKPVIEGLHGIPYRSPAASMRDYLSILVPLLRGERVTYKGEFYNVDGGFSVPGTSAVSVVVGALSEKMVRAAGELADGVVTWLAGPQTLAQTIVPPLRDAAGTDKTPRVIAGMPVAVCDDEAEGRAVANRLFDRYHHLANYQTVFTREGVEGVGGLALVGSESVVEKRLREFADAGVTEFWPMPMPVGDDEAGSLARTRALLRELAPAL